MVDIDAVRDWLGRLPGGAPDDRRAGDWDAFARLDRPVVTLFGAYDTGKSSLLRRLLVDAGGEVPGWLTISARHETFEVNQAAIGDCLVRDTPGLAVDAADLRGQNNSRRAMAAVGLTDVGVAVLTPQLATAEYDVLRELFARGWPAGTMWFVISRFDETGGDPRYGLDEYRELADRKVRELRKVFGLDAEARIFVVAPDPFQTAGPDTDLTPEIWDEFRDWDGVRDLADALAAISPAARPGWRRAAGQRYWTAVLDETLPELRRELADTTARAAVAANGVARRDTWEQELGAIDRAATADLDGLVEQALRRSWDPHSGVDGLADEVRRTLDEWFARHEARLHRLWQSVRKARARERAQPSWAGFAALVATLESGKKDAPAGGGGVAEHVDKFGSMLIRALRATEGKPAAKVAEKAADKINAKAASLATEVAEETDGWRRHLGTAEAFLPLVVHLTKIAGDQWADRARRHQDRAADERLRQVAAEGTRRARDHWQLHVDDVRDQIVAETADQVDLDAGLRDLVEQLRAAVAEGEQLRAAV
ncbi:GTPase domain-containing protein [Actinoplanes sp. HUAS TT8]|uniref:GTPase domain-containing protein n=1 Tax=Actinoplanes sp. HUAS TT8 TaxID=3447453 RepID=UPI003F52591A